MSGTAPRFLELFLAVMESLPRQGPGNRACAERALALCRHLPPSPQVLDLGCGTGGQTLQLAELTCGRIVALDSHAPSIERLRAAISARGLAHRVEARVGDMLQPGVDPGSLDLVWSEGALYNIGIEPALLLCRSLLRPGGYLAFTDAVWRTDDPPAAVRAAFELDYPGMGRVDDVLHAIGRAGFSLVGHFTLPDAAWRDDFYAPMERRIAELRDCHRGDAAALAALEQIAQEPAMHRRHSDCYAYEFFVARRP